MGHGDVPCLNVDFMKGILNSKVDAQDANYDSFYGFISVPHIRGSRK